MINRNALSQHTARQLAPEDDEATIVSKTDALRLNSLQSVNNSLALARQAQEVGASTLGKLHSQTERLNHVDTLMNHTDNSVLQSGHQITELRRLNRSIFTSWFSKPASAPAALAAPRQQGAFTTAIEMADRAKLAPPPVSTWSPSREVPAHASAHDVEEGIDAGLAELMQVSANLRSQAMQMSTVVEAHSAQLPHLSQRMDDTQARVAREERRLRRL